MPLSVEELLKPRYKCIAPFPFMKREGFEVDVIFNPTIEELNYPKLYPANFKSIHWSEDRKPQDMPEYVKCRTMVYKITKWEKYLGWVLTNEHHKSHKCESHAAIDWHFYKNEFIPITKEEYEASLQNNS